MTRSVADAAAMLGAIAGPDPDDPTAVHEPVPDYLAGIGAGVRGLRIGIDRPLNAAARLGADADRYSFIVVDFHHLLLAGLPAHSLVPPIAA